MIALWVLLGLSFSFAIFKHFTAIDTHTIHETTIIEKEYVDTHHVENFVENFAKVYYSWEQSDKSIDNRMESLKGYLTDELQALNVDTVRKDIPVSSSVRGFQIWTVEPTGDNEFNVTYSVTSSLQREKYKDRPLCLYSECLCRWFWKYGTG